MQSFYLYAYVKKWMSEQMEYKVLIEPPNVLITHQFTRSSRQTPQNNFLRRWKLAQKIKETKWVCWRARDTRPLVPSPRGQIHRVQRTGPGGNSEIPDLGILHEMTLPDSAPHWRDAEEIVTWKDWKDSFPGPYLRAAA